MHDDGKLKLARETYIGHAKKMNNAPLDDGWVARVVSGECDHLHGVQIALAAINALDPQLVEAVGLLREIEAQFRFYGDNHAAKPDPVKAKTNYDWADRISAFLAKQGDA